MSNTDVPADEEITITHHVQGQGGAYVAHLKGSDLTGELEWEPKNSPDDDEEVRIATHTLVPKPIRDRGIARRLVERLVADARSKGFKIVPRCSYVAAKFEENPDWSDLRAD